MNLQRAVIFSDLTTRLRRQTSSAVCFSFINGNNFSLFALFCQIKGLTNKAWRAGSGYQLHRNRVSYEISEMKILHNTKPVKCDTLKVMAFTII